MSEAGGTGATAIRVRARSKGVGVGAIAVAAIMAVSCAADDTEEGDDTRQLRMSETRAHMVDELTNLLTTLPEGTFLSRSPQNPELGSVSAGGSTPCTWDYSDPAVYVYLPYWVNGVPASQEETYLQQIVDSLSAAGWAIDSDTRPRSPRVTLRSSDRYNIEVGYAPKRDGSLSIRVSSPCFVEPEEESSGPPPPAIIERP